MVGAGIEKCAVMGDENEAGFTVEILCHYGAGFHVKVVGGLVDEQKAVFTEE